MKHAKKRKRKLVWMLPPLNLNIYVPAGFPGGMQMCVERQSEALKLSIRLVNIETQH